MPANEFEKQVQKQLDDFQLNPSASVWKKVEEQIRQKKRRRIIFFFLLPVFLGLLCYTAYYFLYTGQKTALTKQPVAENSETSSATDKSNIAVKTKEQPATLPSQENDKPDQFIKKETIQKQPTGNIQKDERAVSSNNPPAADKKNKTAKQEDQITGVADKSPASHINKTIPEKKAVPAANDKTKKDVIKTNPTEKPAKTNNQAEEIAINPKDSLFAKQDISKDPIEKKTAKANDPIDGGVVDPTGTVPGKTDSSKTEVVVKTDSKETIKESMGKQKVARRKIKWGIDFSAGITSSQSSVLSLNKTYSDASMLTNTPAAVVGSYPGRSLTLPPSSAKAGPAFRIGVFGELPVSRRSKVLIGLQYAYASTRIKTGTAIANDTALRVQFNNSVVAVQTEQVYRGPQKNSYINSYHFVSMPVQYHWQINKGKKLPVQLNVGLSLSYLLSTNALVYSSSYGGIYYYDKEAINKFHLSAGTGLSLRLKGKKGMEYILGPELSFDTRKLNNNSYQKNQYFIYWGLRTRLLLPGKKK